MSLRLGAPALSISGEAPPLRLTVAMLRKRFPEFTEQEAPDADVVLAIGAAEKLYGLGDLEVLGYLAAHFTAMWITDPAAVDHGAGVVKESGTGELRSILETGVLSPADAQFHRTKYGRTYVALRRAAVTLPW